MSPFSARCSRRFRNSVEATEFRHGLVEFDDVVAGTVLVQKLSHVISRGDSVARRVRRFHSNKPANERGGLISLVFDDPEQFVAHGTLQL